MELLCTIPTEGARRVRSICLGKRGLAIDTSTTPNTRVTSSYININSAYLRRSFHIAAIFFNILPKTQILAVPVLQHTQLKIEDLLLLSGVPSQPGTGKMPSFSTSTLSKVASSLLGSRRNTLVSAPAVTITPAGSVETLNRSVRYNTTDQSSDDESTPLMSELSSPTHNADFANRAFASPPSSDLSPCHDGPQGYSGSPLYPTSCQEEIRLSSRLVTSLSRQDAVDSEDEVQSPWDDPETTVRLVTSLSSHDAVDSEDEVQSPWDDSNYNI
ncbi:hypothetical protein J6590_067715 [Homalodisca vitripennis]|nr:hypothetical protein J6590_067715 [Homalodisca vitripennis]